MIKIEDLLPHRSKYYIYFVSVERINLHWACSVFTYEICSVFQNAPGLFFGQGSWSQKVPSYFHCEQWRTKAHHVLLRSYCFCICRLWRKKKFLPKLFQRLKDAAEKGKRGAFSSDVISVTKWRMWIQVILMSVWREFCTCIDNSECSFYLHN